MFLALNPKVSIVVWARSRELLCHLCTSQNVPRVSVGVGRRIISLSRAIPIQLLWEGAFVVVSSLWSRRRLKEKTFVSLVC